MDSPVTEAQVHFWLVLLIFALAAQTFVLLLIVNAPYGRFARSGWGPAMPARRAWILFESPAVLVFAAVFFTGDHATAVVPLVLFTIWQFHYVLRTFVFPFRIRETGKRIPIVVVAMAVLFNVLNAYVNARWISHLGTYPGDWLTSLPFLAGLALFGGGWLINQRADRALIGLRGSGESGYSIPQGGLFRYVSCPNYLGEIIEWIGWAILSWSLAGAAFAVFTTANLVPRALATHRWYRDTFPDYPRDRKALVPFLL